MNKLLIMLLILSCFNIQQAKNFFNANIFNLTKENDNFRNVLATGNNSQVVLMNILPNQDIGKETHDVDQIIVFTEGTGLALINKIKTIVKPGDLFLIPSGTEHNFINTGKTNLKLFTIYAPAEFKQGLIQKSKSEK